MQMLSGFVFGELWCWWRRRRIVCEIDGRVLGGMQVTPRVQFCKIDRRVLWGMKFGVLIEYRISSKYWIKEKCIRMKITQH